MEERHGSEFKGVTLALRWVRSDGAKGWPEFGDVASRVLVLASEAALHYRRIKTQTTNIMSQPDITTQRCFDTLLAATATDDYDQFVSVADDAFRRGITPTAFHSVSQSL